MVLRVFAAILTLSPISGTVPIDGDYPRGVIFVARFYSVETITVRGYAPKAIKAGRTTQEGAVRIWHGAPNGRYLVSHARGSYVEKTERERGRKTAVQKLVDSTSEFDRLGYSKSGQSDAGDLIPIFPGRRLGVGDSWSPTATITSKYGTGRARYVRISSVVRAPNAHVLATFSVAVRAVLRPSTVYASWTPNLRGVGTLTWDCTEHQRRSSQTTLTYDLVKRGDRIRDVQTERDTLQRIQ